MAVPVRHLVAVTACVSGVAHTYMAAETGWKTLPAGEVEHQD